MFHIGAATSGALVTSVDVGIGPLPASKAGLDGIELDDSGEVLLYEGPADLTSESGGDRDWDVSAGVNWSENW
jgi:hypothetical protein